MKKSPRRSCTAVPEEERGGCANVAAARHLCRPSVAPTRPGAAVCAPWSILPEANTRNIVKRLVNAVVHAIPCVRGIIMVIPPGAAMNGGGLRGNFYEVRTIDVSLPRLDPDSEASCPVPREEIPEHAATESDDGTETQLSEPVFVRTARIGQTHYWIWKFNDPRRGDGYIVVGLWPGGHAMVECDDTFDMTPEQYLVASHFRIEP